LTGKRVSSNLVALLFLVVCIPIVAQSVTSHAIALHGTPKYPASFKHFDYVNPLAPKGGQIKIMGHGTFDTLNPYTLRGLSPFNSPGLYMFGPFELSEPLMVGSSGYAPSGDEAQSAYGLIAESVEFPEDRSWALFTLRPEARFHDGSAITADDVVFSFNTLVKHGSPIYAQKYIDVESVKKVAIHQVLFTFKGEDTRALPLRAGELQVLSKAFWEGRDFEKSILDYPLTSGPYRIKSIEAGRSLVFERVKDYWGRNLPVNVGRYNFDEIRVDFYRDLDVALEAFKSGDFDVFLEYTSRNWATAYDFPALNDGHVIKEELEHQEAAGSQAYFLNNRRKLFEHIKVRKALGLMFDFEWTKKALFYGAYTRNNTWFPNTELAAPKLPSEAELSLLEPFRDQLPEQLFTLAFISPVTDGTGNIRSNQREALRLFAEAGWVIRDGKMVNGKTGERFVFEVLEEENRSVRILLPFKQNLAKIGVELNVRMVDRAQYKARLDQFDFDMVTFVLPQTLSPGPEIREYFHSESANTPGMRNYAGIENPVADALIGQALAANGREELVTIVNALDRVLMWNYYTIPQWHNSSHRVARWDIFGKPPYHPPYSFNFRDWWWDKNKAAKLGR